MNTLTDITLNVSFWGMKKMYNMGYWIVCGKQKSDIEILLEKQNIKMEMIHLELLNISKKIEGIDKIKDEYSTMVYSNIKTDISYFIEKNEIYKKLNKTSKKINFLENDIIIEIDNDLYNDSQQMLIDSNNYVK